MKAYLTITTILITGLYLAGYSWPDTEEHIANKCDVSNGEYTVYINSEPHICWRRGGLENE